MIYCTTEVYEYSSILTSLKWITGHAPRKHRDIVRSKSMCKQNFHSAFYLAHILKLPTQWLDPLLIGGMGLERMGWIRPADQRITQVYWARASQLPLLWISVKRQHNVTQSRELLASCGNVFPFQTAFLLLGAIPVCKTALSMTCSLRTTPSAPIAFNVTAIIATKLDKMCAEWNRISSARGKSGVWGGGNG